MMDAARTATRLDSALQHERIGAAKRAGMCRCMLAWRADATRRPCTGRRPPTRGKRPGAGVSTLGGSDDNNNNNDDDDIGDSSGTTTSAAVASTTTSAAAAPA